MKTEVSLRIKRILSGVAGVAIALLLALPYLVFGQEIRQQAAVGYLGLLVACAVSNCSVLLPSSSTIIVTVAATTLNPILCVIFGGVGSAIGEQSSYLCGRLGANAAGIARGDASRVTVWLRKHAFLTVFLFALIPLPIFDVAGIAAGASRIRWPVFAVAALLGKVTRFAVVLVLLFLIVPWWISQAPQPLSGQLQQLLARAGL